MTIDNTGLSPSAGIRARYPNPRRPSAHQDDPGSYCCGGAICMYAWTFFHPEPVADFALVVRFPTAGNLVTVLMRLNPALDHATAHGYAQALIACNDRENFVQAWRIADQALTYTPKED